MTSAIDKKSFWFALSILLSIVITLPSTNGCGTCTLPPPPPSPPPTVPCPPPPSPSPPPPSPPPPSPPPPSPKPSTPCPPPPTSPKPPSPPAYCPRDTLKLGVCAELLGTAHAVVGKPPSGSKCCVLLDGLADLEAAACLCTAIKAKVLGVKVDVPVAISVLLSACQKTVPPGFTCK